MSQQIRVLYVDDDLDSLQDWAEKLREHDGVEVLAETNIDDGLAQLSTSAVDCILSDISVSDETNLDFLTAVRKEYPDLPFILFTEDMPDRTINEAIEAGATDYVPKSLADSRNSLLITRIEQAIANSPGQQRTGGKAGTSNDATDSLADAGSASSSQVEPEGASVSGPGTETGSAIDFAPAPGTSALLQCKSHTNLKTQSCTHLLGGGNLEDRNVVMVRYKSIDEARLVRIAERANRLKLISVGYTQSSPGQIDDLVEIVSINNPSDVTRLGIVVTGAVQNWVSSESDTVVCFDSLNVLLRYKSVKKVFQFLHILLAKLEEADAISHFHIDHTAEEIQKINSLKPIFDTILKVNTSENRVERANS